jgi:hypothetical protein
MPNRTDKEIFFGFSLSDQVPSPESHAAAGNKTAEAARAAAGHTHGMQNGSQSVKTFSLLPYNYGPSCSHSDVQSDKKGHPGRIPSSGLLIAYTTLWTVESHT